MGIRLPASEYDAAAAVALARAADRRGRSHRCEVGVDPHVRQIRLFQNVSSDIDWLRGSMRPTVVLRASLPQH